MTGWLNEIDAGMNAVIHNVHTIDLVLGIEIRIETRLNILDNWSPRGIIVDKIAEARSVDNGQT
jgi:hypothetical protein